MNRRHLLSKKCRQFSVVDLILVLSSLCHDSCAAYTPPRLSSFDRIQRTIFNQKPLHESLDDYNECVVGFVEEAILHADDDESAAVDASSFSSRETNQDSTTSKATAKTTTLTRTTQLSEHYRQDFRDKSSEPLVNPVGLSLLLEQRFEARRAKNFTHVVVLDRRLSLEHNVRAYDHPPIWTRLHEPPAAHFRRKQDQRIQNTKRIYGPQGHPYTQVGAADIDPMFCPLSMTNIHTLLSQRTRCLTNGLAEQASAIDLELLIHGVRVHDDLFQWTADRLMEFDNVSAMHNKDNNTAGNHSQVREPLRAAIYNPNVMSEPSGEAQLRIQQRIEQLIKTRAEAMVRRENQLVRLLTFELYKTYDVGVDDVSHSWSAGCVFAVDGDISDNSDSAVDVSWKPPSLSETLIDFRSPQVVFPPLLFAESIPNDSGEPPFRRSIHSILLEDERALDRVTELVQERNFKREEGKFLESDAIRNELWHAYVSLKDLSLLRLFCLLLCWIRSDPFIVFH